MHSIVFRGPAAGVKRLRAGEREKRGMVMTRRGGVKEKRDAWGRGR